MKWAFWHCFQCCGSFNNVILLHPLSFCNSSIAQNWNISDEPIPNIHITVVQYYLADLAEIQKINKYYEITMHTQCSECTFKTCLELMCSTELGQSSSNYTPDLSKSQQPFLQLYAVCLQVHKMGSQWLHIKQVHSSRWIYRGWPHAISSTQSSWAPK